MPTSFPLPIPSFQGCFPENAPPMCGNRLDISLWMVKLLLEVHPRNVGRGQSPSVPLPRQAWGHPPPGERTLPRVLVAMSATFWKASRKATAASTVVLRQRERGGYTQWVQDTLGCANEEGGPPCPTRSYGHSPELGVQLGGLRVEILPYGVGALQGRRVMVRDRAPHPLHCFSSQGRTPSTGAERQGSLVASLMANKG